MSVGLALLDANPDWSFPYRASVNAADVRLAVAEAGVIEGPDGFPVAQSMLNVLQPANGLNPSLPESWVVDGTPYTTYEAALLRALQAVQASIGGSGLFGQDPRHPA